MSEKENTMTTTAARTMPTEADVPEIAAVAEAYSGEDWIYEVTVTSGGVLVRYSVRYASSPAPALQAVGYSARDLREGLVLVTGAVDQVALLDAQITALTRRRQVLVAEREDEAEFEARMGGPF